MTDDKLRIMEVATSGDEAEASALAEDAEIDRLKRRVEELEYENMNLHYTNGGLNDAARLNTAAAILAGLIKVRPSANDDVLVKRSIKIADSMVTHYTDMMNTNAIEYQRLLSLQGRETEGGEN